MSSGLELKPPSEPPSVEGLDDDEAVEVMTEWFTSNFEDPAMETPYETAEGGYQFIWGGPYNAEEELADAFPEASDEARARATEEIETGGLFDWAPAGHRIRPDDEPDDDLDERDSSTSLETRLAALSGQLDRIEQHIAYWKNVDPQIGHNGPPDEFRLYPSDEELVAADASVADIRAELAKPDRENSADINVVERSESAFRRLASKIWRWIKVSGGALAVGILGGIGKNVGEELMKDPHAFLHVLNEASSTLSLWVQHLAAVI